MTPRDRMPGKTNFTSPTYFRRMGSHQKRVVSPAPFWGTKWDLSRLGTTQRSRSPFQRMPSGEVCR